MKKVLFVLNYMNIGGTEKAFLNLVDTLPPEEYDITLLLLEKKELHGSTGILMLRDGRILFYPNGSGKPSVDRSMIYVKQH